MIQMPEKEFRKLIQNLNNSIRETSNQLSDLSTSEDLRETQRIIDAEQKKLEDMKEEIEQAGRKRNPLLRSGNCRSLFEAAAGRYRTERTDYRK